MNTPVPDKREVEAVAKELIDIRGRGPDRIDLTSHNQKPLQIEHVERLAAAYSRATGAEQDPANRAGLVARLLRDALAAYAEQGNEAPAAFITDMLFDPPTQAAPRLPGERLEAATKQHAPGKTFDTIRTPLFRAFAEFLISFVARVAAGDANEPAAAPPPLGIGSSRRRRITTVLAAVAVLLIAVAGAGYWLAAGQPDQPPARNDPAATVSGTPDGTTRPVTVTGQTYTQVCGVRGGCPVFDDPRTPSRAHHQKLAFLEEVEVTCKVYAPSMESVEWWYLLASEPYNGEWWAPAVNFLNGDPVEGPYLNDVNEGVRDC